MVVVEACERHHDVRRHDCKMKDDSECSFYSFESEEKLDEAVA